MTIPRLPSLQLKGDATLPARPRLGSLSVWQDKDTLAIRAIDSDGTTYTLVADDDWHALQNVTRDLLAASARS